MLLLQRSQKLSSDLHRCSMSYRHMSSSHTTQKVNNKKEPSEFYLGRQMGQLSSLFPYLPSLNAFPCLLSLANTIHLVGKHSKVLILINFSGKNMICFPHTWTISNIFSLQFGFYFIIVPDARAPAMCHLLY